MSVVNSHYAVFVMAFVELTGFLPHGMNLVVLNPAMPALQEFVNRTSVERSGEPASQAHIDLMINLAQSMLIVGTAFGSLFSHPLIANLRRKQCVMVYNVGTVTSAVLMSAVTYYSARIEPLIVGRFISGFCRGLGVIIVPLYVAETCTRSSLAFYQAAISPILALGSVVISVLGLPGLLGSCANWPYLLAFTGAPCTIAILASPWLPESVGWAIKRERSRDGKARDVPDEKAMKLLRRLRSGDDASIADEYRAIVAEIDSDARFERATIREVVANKAYRRQLVACMVVMMSMQAVGMQVISMYTNTVMEEAGVSADSSTIVTIGIFSYLIAVNVASMLLIKRVGARKLFLIGTSVTEAGLIVLVFASLLNARGIPNMEYLTISAIVLCFSGVMMGTNWGSTVLPAELTTQTTRPAALWLGNCAFWLVGTIVIFVTPFALRRWGGYAYLPFVLLTFVEILFVWKKVPKTHNRSVAQIQAQFGGSRDDKNATELLPSHDLHGNDSSPESTLLQ